MAKSTLTNPQATVIIWNYKDRLNTQTDGDPDAQDQVLVLTASLKSISTVKSKSNPTGSFTFTLAPTFNWTSRITPGSWCTILMTRDEPIPPLNDQQLPGADVNRDKMFGRIQAVRVNISVDGKGGRQTEYVVTGSDWGSVFEQPLYIDPTISKNVLEKYSTMGQAMQLSYSNQLSSYLDKGLPTSHDAVRGIIRLWGAPIKDASDILSADTGLLTSPDRVFRLPKEVIKYFNFTASGTSASTIDFADLLHDNTQTGRLTAYNTYSGDLKEAFGFYAPDTIMGHNTLWQLINENANTTLNEVYADFQWDGDDKPNMSLIRRIRPFVNNEGNKDLDPVRYLVSPFKYVKRNKIALEDVLTLSAGTNIDNRINFVEILPNVAELKVLEVQTKVNSQVFDTSSISRDGFRPKFEKPKYIPYQEGKIVINQLTDWKNLIKEWHFNTHLMLNGSVTIIGQDPYIGVGENIMIPAQVLGEANMNDDLINKGLIDPATGKPNTPVFLTAHIENIAHNFSINSSNGARTFITTIDFVRGIITDEDGNTINGSDDSNIAIDSDAQQQNAKNRERNRNNVAVSTDRDPDTRRFKEDSNGN